MSISFGERRKGITSESHIAFTLWRLVEVASHTTTRRRAGQEGGVGAELASGESERWKGRLFDWRNGWQRATNKRCEGGWCNYKGGGLRVREGGGGKRERTRRRRRRGRREVDTGGGNGKRTRRRGRIESYTGGGKHTGRGRPVLLQGRPVKSSRGRLENHKRHESHNTTRLNF